MNTKGIIKFVLGIKQKEDLSVKAFIRCWHRRLGPYFYKKRFTSADVVAAMERAGMRQGSTVLIQSSWGEFYNYDGTPNELIKAILEKIGETGTLCMACMPKVDANGVFDVRESPSTAGYLSECFRKYPGVKRSISTRHSVCGIGPNADFLLSEHHLGKTPWDEKSPYYKLSEVNGLVFGFGLGPYWIGTISHCVESVLKDQIPYYTDMWDKEMTKYTYVDYDGTIKYYYNYSMPIKGSHIRITSYFKNRMIANRYLHSHYQKVSNLEISCFEAKEIIDVLVKLARKGKDINLLPLKIGYKFPEK